jgi:hypothetical protein
VNWAGSPRRSQQRIACAVAVIVSASVIANTLIAFQMNRARVSMADVQGDVLNESQYVDWLETCRWCSNSSQPHSRFLAPPSHQTFKWYANRSEVVNWKDIPQDVARIVGWHARLETVRLFLREATVMSPEAVCQRLRDLAREYQFQYFIAERSRRLPSLPLRIVFQNTHYVVYHIGH